MFLVLVNIGNSLKAPSIKTNNYYSIIEITPLVGDKPI